MAPVLVIWMGRVAVLPTKTAPKSSDAGVKVSVEGVAAPTRLMKSSAVLASVVISRALMRVSVASEAVCNAFCGVKVTMMEQLAPGTMEVQPLWREKSRLVWRLVM